MEETREVLLQIARNGLKAVRAYCDGTECCACRLNAACNVILSLPPNGWKDELIDFDGTYGSWRKMQ